MYWVEKYHNVWFFGGNSTWSVSFAFYPKMDIIKLIIRQYLLSKKNIDVPSDACRGEGGGVGVFWVF